MISIPIYDTINEVTIFRDDEEWTQFYYLPRNPTIAMGGDGKPQFSFIYYESPLDRGNAEKGGGYLVFTTVMKEDSETLEDIRRILTQRCRAERPEELSPITATLTAVDFTDGEVRLIMMDDKNMIKGDVNLGKPSFLGDNTASVAIELTENGANLFYQALTAGASIGAIEYDLKFPIRLPGITIRGHVDSTEVKTAVMTYTMEEIRDNSIWHPTYVSYTPHRDSISETMYSQGLVTLEIIKGNVDLKQEDMDSLRAFAFGAMDNFIKEHFLKGGTIETEEDRKSVWMNLLHQDITARFDLDVTYRDVIKRQYNPSAQINPSFLGVPVSTVAFPIDLDNSWFNDLEVVIDTNIDFDKYSDIIYNVVAHLSYDQPRRDGTRKIEAMDVAFSATDRSPKTFRTRLADASKDTYHVEVEVNYKSGPVLKTILKKLDTTVRHLTLDVPNPGVIEINVAAAPNAFDDKLLSAEVDIRYGDPDTHVPEITETVLLSKDKASVNYRRVIYAPWARPYSYRVTYVLKDDAGMIYRSTTDWVNSQGTPGQTGYIAVRTPFDESFNLNIAPSADWDTIKEIVVDLEYDDAASDYHLEGHKSFSRQQSGSQKWQFPLRDPDHRNYTFSETWLMTDGGVKEKPVEGRDSDFKLLVVGNARDGVSTVKVDPSDLDIGVGIRRVLVQLSYEDPGNNISNRQTLVFKDKTPQPWSIALADDRVDGYVYDVAYIMADGTKRSLTAQGGKISGNSSFLFLPQPPSA